MHYVGACIYGSIFLKYLKRLYFIKKFINKIRQVNRLLT
jgi:hypothetical protein